MQNPGNVIWSHGRIGSHWIYRKYGSSRPNGFNRNNLTIADGTGQTFGTPTTPLAGIVYQPTGPTSGEVRFGNGSFAPVVGFTNINGSDAAGLVVNGSPFALSRLLHLDVPIRDATYSLGEIGHPNLADVLAPWIERWQP